MAGRVRLVGPQPHAALGRFYGAADLLVLASSREGWANVLLEAMACGTPVVASDIPGNPEVVRERTAGLIVSDEHGRRLRRRGAGAMARPAGSRGGAALCRAVQLGRDQRRAVGGVRAGPGALRRAPATVGQAIAAGLRIGSGRACAASRSGQCCGA